jgi:hypothetical protein
MTEETAAELHPLAAHLAPLLGTWQGQGRGSYPTIETFGYLEEVSFGHAGKPFLAYTQRTKHSETGLPLHVECGYLRPIGSDRVEFVLVHPTGILESLAGTVTADDDGLVLDLQVADVIGTATAVSVTELNRRFEVRGSTMKYELAMAAVGQPLTHHLAAELHRGS